MDFQTSYLRSNREVGYRFYQNRIQIKLGINVPNSVDVYSIPEFKGAYTKGFPHLETLLVNPKSFQTFLQALSYADVELLQEIQLGGKRRLDTPSTLFSFDQFGVLKASIPLAPHVSMKSPLFTTELTDLYNISELRDVPFPFVSVEGIDFEKRYLRNMTEIGGDPISSFFYNDIPLGPKSVKQTYIFYAPGIDYLKTRPETIDIQNGAIPLTAGTYLSIEKYITTLRDGATFVQDMDVLQFFTNIVYWLESQNAPLNPLSPFRTGVIFTENSTVLGGHNDVIYVMTSVARNVISSVWYNKWKYLRPRPEEVGVLLDQSKLIGTETPFISPSQEVLAPIYAKQGNWLLTQVYPGGAPLNPSYPSAHAALAGALVTVIKAYYDESFLFEGLIPSPDGLSVSKSGKTTSLGAELNKAAYNIGAFQVGAGIHYNSDLTYSFGQEVALRYFDVYFCSYPWPFGARFTLFNGQTYEWLNTKPACVLNEKKKACDKKQHKKH